MSKDLVACIFKANVLETYLFPVFVLLLVCLFRRERLKERCKPSTNTRDESNKEERRVVRTRCGRGEIKMAQE